MVSLKRELRWGGVGKGTRAFIINSSEPSHFSLTMNMHLRKKAFAGYFKGEKRSIKKKLFSVFHPTKTEWEHQEKYLIQYEVLITVLETQKGHNSHQ